MKQEHEHCAFPGQVHRASKCWDDTCAIDGCHYQRLKEDQAKLRELQRLINMKGVEHGQES